PQGVSVQLAGPAKRRSTRLGNGMVRIEAVDRTPAGLERRDLWLQHAGVLDHTACEGPVCDVWLQDCDGPGTPAAPTPSQARVDVRQPRAGAPAAPIGGVTDALAAR